MKAVILLCIFLFTAALAADEEDYGFKCKVGVSYRENHCNRCICNTYQSLSCTYMACTSHQDPKLRDCEKGNTWNEGCEQCWCTSLGTICTVDCGKVLEQNN